jgi:hypothetical protein
MPKTRQQRPPPLVIALAIVLALLLTWPASIALRNGLAGIYARPAIDYLEQKRFSTDTVSEAQWQAIDHSVTQADRLMPGNPQYLEALGRLHQIKLSAFADDLSIEEMDAHAKAASEYFFRAMENRPTWPYYWGNLALEHYRLGNFGTDDYNQALSNASRFGPWKNDTQRLVMDLGSETWEFLSPGAQREFILNLERALHRQPQNALQIVSDNGAWPRLCAASKALLDITQPHLRALCAQDRFAEKVDQY